MKSEPVEGLVSVVMPAYNCEKTIAASIESVIKQTHSNWELCISDDCSKDGTAEVVARFDDPRIRFLALEKNGGAAAARNNSLQHARGQFIAFLDADDTWQPEKLEQQIKAMKEAGCAVSHCSYTRMDSSLSRPIGLVKAKRRVTYKDMLKENCIGNLTGMYDRSRLGLFLQESIGHEDYLMWLEIIRGADSVGVAEPLANYRVQPGSLSGNKFNAAKWQYRILRDRLKLPTPLAILYLGFYLFNAARKRL